MAKGKVEYSNYKGFSIIGLPYGKNGLKFGKGKAKVILAHIGEIAQFVEDDDINVVAELLGAFETYSSTRLEAWRSQVREDRPPLVQFLKDNHPKLKYSVDCERGTREGDASPSWANVPLCWKDNERGSPVDVAAEAAGITSEELLEALASYRVPVAPTKSELLDEYLNEPAYDIAAG